MSSDTPIDPTERAAWHVLVTVPADLPGPLGRLFSLVANAVHTWEPSKRDGWVADMSAAGLPAAPVVVWLAGSSEMDDEVYAVYATEQDAVEAAGPSRHRIRIMSHEVVGAAPAAQPDDGAVSVAGVMAGVLTVWPTPDSEEAAIERHAYELKIRADVEAILDGELGTEPTPETENGYVANVQLVVDRLSQARAEVEQLRAALTNARAKNGDHIADREKMLRDIMAERDEARRQLQAEHQRAEGWHNSYQSMRAERDEAQQTINAYLT
jgi:hypothetical protein